MATTTLTYSPASGRQYIDLTSWAGDASFATTPVSGDQVEAVDTLTLNADGSVSGSDGSYTLRHIQAANGANEAVNYSLTNPDVTAPTISALSATGTDPDTIDVSVDTDEDDGTLFVFASTNASETEAAIKSGAQGSQTVSAAGTQTLALTLSTGDYYVHVMHEDSAGNQSNVLSSAQITLAPIIETASTTVTYSVGADKTLVTLAGTINEDPYLTGDFASAPEAGEQAISSTAEGAFNENFYWSGDAEGVYTYWYVNNDGVLYARTIDTAQLQELPDANVVIESVAKTRNTITIEFSYAGTDAASFEYQLDDGTWTTTTTPVALTGLTADTEYTIGIRPVDTEGVAGYPTTTTVRTNAAVDTTPRAFSFTAQTNVARSISVTSNAITVQDVDAATDIPVTIAGDTGSQYSVSTDGGATWGGWTNAQTNVRLNYQIRVRHTTSDEYSSGGYDGVRETTLTVGGVSATFRSTTLADTTPPVISLTGGNLNWTQGTPWVEPGYSAIDNADGDISVTGVEIIGTPDVNTLGPQQILYRATDASGNVSESTRTVTIVEATPDDQTAPTITLTGGNRTLTVGEAWSDPGFSATDETDGDLTDQVVVTGTVNTAQAGTYTLTYSVTDAAGNTGTATRTVTVLPATQYPMDSAAPAKRTVVAERLLKFMASEPLFLMQSGEILDYDFDLSDWLTEQGGNLAAGSHEILEIADALEVLASGQVPGTSRIKVWLKAGAVTDSQTSLVQLTAKTDGYRTAVFQFRVVIINRMQ